MKKKTIGTLGKGEKAKEFQYCGSYRDGVVIFFESGEKQIPSELFARALSDHAGKSVDGGFSMTEPTPGGLGEWLERASNKTLRSRHASFMAAILCEEAGVRHRYERNRVLLDFPEGG